MNKASTLAAFSVLLLTACSSGIVPPPPPPAASSSSAISSVSSSSDISVSQPLPNTQVTSPLTVSGEARGSWYFEASFPVRLLDGNGLEIAVTPATALSDWMTTNFVPYTATLTFATPATATGLLILEKDNPSGLSQNSGSIVIPVQF